MLKKIVTICNQKGGTGKTTTAVNLSSLVASKTKRVLLIDTDPQGNATSGVGINKMEIKNSVYEVLLLKCTAKEAIVQTEVENLDLMPCNINLTGAEIELVGALSRETRLKRALEEVKDDYDYIFIDAPPSLGLLTLNSLVASNSIIIPIQCEFYALEGVSQLLRTISLIKDGLNESLEVEGVLMTMADYRTNLTNEVISEIKDYFKEKVYESVIPRNIRLSECPSYGKPIHIYDSSSIGSKKYVELSDEFLKNNNYGCKSLENNCLNENVQNDNDEKSGDLNTSETNASIG